MAVERVAYYGQEVQVTINGTSHYLPVKTAACDFDVPSDVVMAYGSDTPKAVVQNQPTTCKSNVQCFLSKAVPVTMLQNLVTNGTSGSLTTIAVRPCGFTMSGILTDIGMDVSVGALSTLSLGFQGMGYPYLSSVTGNAISGQDNMPSSVSLVTTEEIEGTPSRRDV